MKITRNLAGTENWSPEEILKRQQRLGEWARQRWHVEQPPALPPEGWERLVENARRYGFEKEFIELREAALKLGLGESPGKNCMRYKPTYNWTLSAFTIYIYYNALWILLRPQNFPRRSGLTKERILHVFGNCTEWWLPADRFPGFLNRFDRLFDEKALLEMIVPEPTPVNFPDEQPKTMGAKLAEAEKFGLRIELEAIHSAAGKLGMWPTVRKGIHYRNPYRGRCSTMVVYVQAGGFTIYFYFGGFALFPGVTREIAKEVLQVNDGWNWIPKEKLPGVVEALEKFYEKLYQQ